MKRHLTYVLLLVASFAIYMTNLSTLPYINYLHNLLKNAVQPLFELQGTIKEKTQQTVKTYLLLRDANIENQRLRLEVQECALQRAMLQTCQHELYEMEKTLNLTSETKNPALVFARVLAYDPSGNDTFLIINKGQGSELKEGMIVFHGDKLVGIIDKVYSSTSRVRTVFSDEFSISASSGDKAYIYRGGFPHGMLLHARLEDELTEGAPVYLRLIGKNFPQLHIGNIFSVSEEGKSFFKKVLVKPSVEIRGLSLCVVIKEEL